MVIMHSSNDQEMQIHRNALCSPMLTHSCETMKTPQKYSRKKLFVLAAVTPDQVKNRPSFHKTKTEVENLTRKPRRSINMKGFSPVAHNRDAEDAILIHRS